MLDFVPYRQPISEGLETSQDVPKELDLFFKAERDFLPAGKTIKDLTPEEIQIISNQYKFSPLKPGLYQQITGINNY